MRGNLKPVSSLLVAVLLSLGMGVSASHAARSGTGAAALILESEAVYVEDLKTGTTLIEKNAESQRPIASITKLMTAMVALDGKEKLDERLTITDADVDRVKHSSSRLQVGSKLTRGEMLRLALMSSENRAAHALARTYPGGVSAFVTAMNKKARALGLKATRFADPTGLNPRNVSTPEELARLVAASAKYPEIRSFSTDDQQAVAVSKRKQTFRNTNLLVRNNLLDVIVSKTGYIAEAGRCLVMQALINNRPTLIVLLDADRKEGRIKDALSIKKWLERKDTRHA